MSAAPELILSFSVSRNDLHIFYKAIKHFRKSRQDFVDRVEWKQSAKHATFCGITTFTPQVFFGYLGRMLSFI